ncbi:uncharacterized protein LOC105838618 isoform X2 [Monomorium pharaonis]|uniref:uncharacterized protein LOC105838618 isoform X2 n=1 Tax=Monomorium pharaonis TaxID=307658 RepID=UPI001746DB0A|nr:uncharacterized protein LOC105838618 isoform X2 [Monomorium pharaonis]
MSALPSALRLTSCCRCCCWLLLICLVVFLIPAPCTSDTPRQIINRTRKSAGDNNAALHESSYLDDDAEEEQISNGNGELEDWLDANITAEKGRYLGSPCDTECNSELQHVFCDSITGLCECEKFYPVRLGPTKGCAKPKKLGEQCFYRATCTFVDQHSTCTQIQHNAVCDCEEGYHRVALSRPNKKVFCAEDLVVITTDLPTLLCIASGIAIFTAMICFVLKLFSGARFSRPRHYANANHAPPMLFSSDTGIPLTLHGRPSSRSSQRSSSAGPLSCAFTRRPSSGGSRGPLVPASRAGAARAAAILLISCHLQATKDEGNKHRRTLSDVAEGSTDATIGSRRPSLASVHSSTSSSRSYSARRLEKERNDKEQRQALQELRLAKQREQLQQQQQQVVPTPSPRTPHSTDELLPSVEEGKESFYNDVPTKSDISDAIPTTITMMTTTTTTTTMTTTTTTSTTTTTTTAAAAATTSLTTAITISNESTTRMGDTAPMATPTTIFGTGVAPRASDDIFQINLHLPRTSRRNSPQKSTQDFHYTKTLCIINTQVVPLSSPGGDNHLIY